MAPLLGEDTRMEKEDVAVPREAVNIWPEWQ